VDGIFGGGGGGGNGPIKKMLRKKCKRVCKIEKLRVVCTPISKIGAGFDDEYFDDDEVRECVGGGSQLCLRMGCQIRLDPLFD
jgi:hypothetical protein